MASELQSFTPKAILWGGKACDVPKDVAVCPECGGELYVWCVEWDDETGQPTQDGLQVDCENEPFYEDDEETGDDEHEHRWFQSDWQPVIDKVKRWACVSAD